MNIKDVAPPPKVESAREQAEIIFARQTELEDTYWKLEKRYSPSISVNNREGQTIIKDFLWRITEEVGEALEAKFLNQGYDKYCEEFADGLHFVVGLCVILNAGTWWSRAYIEAKAHPLGANTSDLVRELGILGNHLKMKPWKQTDIMTDEESFYRQLYVAVKTYLFYCHSKGFHIDDLFPYYWRKSEVNLFRIRSKY